MDKRLIVGLALVCVLILIIRLVVLPSQSSVELSQRSNIANEEALGETKNPTPISMSISTKVTPKPSFSDCSELLSTLHNANANWAREHYET